MWCTRRRVTSEFTTLSRKRWTEILTSWSRPGVMDSIGRRHRAVGERSASGNHTSWHRERLDSQAVQGGRHRMVKENVAIAPIWCGMKSYRFGWLDE
jgi:hypothetical protein